MFRASSCPSSGATTTAVAASGLPSKLGDSSAVGGDRAEHDQQHCYHQASTVKPEAATPVVELLMMGVRTPKTCWAVFKQQVVNLRNWCIWLVDSVESMMMHRPANPKFIDQHICHCTLLLTNITPSMLASVQCMDHYYFTHCQPWCTILLWMNWRLW
jgi:hypothetical protein